MSYGFFVSAPDAPTRRLHIGGSNAGLQAGLYVYPDHDLIIAVLSNTWGIGAQSGEMNGALLERLAAICMGWPQPPPVNYAATRLPRLLFSPQALFSESSGGGDI